MPMTLDGTNGISLSGGTYNIQASGSYIATPAQPAFFAIGLPTDLYATALTSQLPITFRDCTLNRTSSWNGTLGSSTSNGNKFTAPAAGVYYFAWEGMYKHAGTGDITMQVWKNGSQVSYNNCHTHKSGDLTYVPPWSMAQVNWIGTLAVNDYVDFRMASSNDGATYWYAAGLYNKCYGWMIG